MKKRVWGLLMAAIMVANCLFSNDAMLTANAASADFGITLDGDSVEWDFIKKNQVDSGGFAQVAAFTKDVDLYILREMSDMSQYGQDELYIDTDGDSTNGYLLNGSDYLLQGSGLYAYNGTGGGWGWDTSNNEPFTVKFSEDKSVGEYKIPLSSLGNPASNVTIKVKIQTTYGNEPVHTTTFADVMTFEQAYQEDDSAPIQNVAFTSNGDLKALTDATMEGGVVGTLSAEGGTGKFSYAFAVSSAYGPDNGRFVIDGNKIVVKDGLLAPGSYNVYVKVTSGIRTTKKAISLTVASADAATEITESVFAGKLGQWFAVSYNAANAIPTLTEMKAATDGNKLYAYVSAGTALSNKAVFYVSTSGTSGVGMSHVWTDADSVEYKIDMDGKVYAYKGNAWTAVGTAEIYKTSDAAEIAVDLSVLGNATGVIKVAVEEQGNSLLPNAGNAMYAVSTPIMETMPSITHDGALTDWANISPIAGGTGTVGDLYAVHDDHYLYVMTTLSDVTASDLASTTTALSTDLLINADGDTTTGVQLSAFANGSGAEFLVQDWNSILSPNGNVEFFYAAGTTSGWAGVGSNTTYKKVTDLGDNKYCVEFAVPLSVMRQSTKTVSDDIYVAIARDESMEYNTGLASGTKAGRTDSDAFVFVPKYKTSVAVKVGDKTFTDWNCVSKKAANTSTDSTCNLFATRSSERLYTLVTNDLGGLNTVNTYFLDTANGGYEVFGYKGVEYIVKGGKLYAVTGNNTLSEALDEVWMNYYNDNIEMQLYLSQIGNPRTIKIAWRGVDGTLALPADGKSYLNVTNEMNMQRDPQYYYPVEDFATFANPYKGWVGWAGEYGRSESIKYDQWEDGAFYYDYDTVYLAVRWRELQPNSDQDWELDTILEKYDIPEWIAAGKRVNFRFVMDNPEELNGAGRRMDIPDWLYEELVEANGVDGAGTFYHDATGSMGLGYDVAGFSPNYYSEKMIERHDEIIRKLAEYFDNTSITAFVQVGSIGHWGEFHTWPDGTGIWPNPSTCAKYMEPYVKYFKNVKCGVRKPYPYAAEHDFGLFNDIFGVDAGTPEFYNYFMNGDTDMNGGATDAEIAASKMPEFWKTNYSGGEFARGQVREHITNDTAKDGSKGIMSSMDQVRYTHVSWLGPCSAADLEVNEIAASVYETNVLAMQKLMGYNFALEKISKVGTVKQNTATALNMVWNNEGVAPFYYEWPIELSLINGNGKVVWKQTFDGDITTWMPGRTNVNLIVTIPTSVSAGNYTLAIAIADKDTNEPGMNLAIEGGREDGRYPLYSLTVQANPVSTGTGNVTNENAVETKDVTEDIKPEVAPETETEDPAAEDEAEEDAEEETVTFDDVISADEIVTVEVPMEDLQTVIETAGEGAFEVKMADTTVVEPEIFESARGKNVDIVLTLANDVKWHINGNDIAEGEVPSIDFDVVLNTTNIPEEMASSVETENSSLQFEIKHNGEFGFKAALTLPVGAENAGKVATLYWYDEANGSMVAQGKNVVNENGNATFAFTHASDYIVVIDEKATTEESAEGSTELGDVDAPLGDIEFDTESEDAVNDVDTTPTGNAGIPTWAIVLLILFAFAVGTYVVVNKILVKKGESENE